MKYSALKLRRMKARMDVDVVARLLDITTRKLYKIEEGHQKLTLQIAVKLTKIYNCSIYELCKDIELDIKINK